MLIVAVKHTLCRNMLIAWILQKSREHKEFFLGLTADAAILQDLAEAAEESRRKQQQLEAGDTFYMFSDGYIDQHGGEHRKKFMSSRFKSLLLDIQGKTMPEQKAALESTLDDWMGRGDLLKQGYEQIDDIVVMGIEI